MNPEVRVRLIIGVDLYTGFYGSSFYEPTECTIKALI